MTQTEKFEIDRGVKKQSKIRFGLSNDICNKIKFTKVTPKICSSLLSFDISLEVVFTEPQQDVTLRKWKEDESKAIFFFESD